MPGYMGKTLGWSRGRRREWGTLRPGPVLEFSLKRQGRAGKTAWDWLVSVIMVGSGLLSAPWLWDN